MKHKPFLADIIREALEEKNCWQSGEGGEGF